MTVYRSSNVPGPSSVSRLRGVVAVAIGASAALLGAGCTEDTKPLNLKDNSTLATTTSTPNSSTTASDLVDVFGTGISNMDMNPDGTVTVKCVVGENESVSLSGSKQQVQDQCDDLIGL